MVPILCVGLQKDEELLIYEGWWFCNMWWLVFEKDKRKAKYSKVWLFLWKLIEGVK
jgi:hypothetical protein